MHLKCELALDDFNALMGVELLDWQKRLMGAALAPGASKPLSLARGRKYLKQDYYGKVDEKVHQEYRNLFDQARGHVADMVIFDEWMGETVAPKVAAPRLHDPVIVGIQITIGTILGVVGGFILGVVL